MDDGARNSTPQGSRGRVAAQAEPSYLCNFCPYIEICPERPAQKRLEVDAGAHKSWSSTPRHAYYPHASRPLPKRSRL